LTAIGSAVVGWTVGTLVASAATGRPTREALGSRARARATVVAMLALVTVGVAAAYRPSRVEPPAGVTALGLAPDTGFDYPAAVHHRDAAQGQGALTEHPTASRPLGGRSKRLTGMPQRRSRSRDPAGRAEPRPRHVAHGLGDDEEAPSGPPTGVEARRRRCR